MTKHYMYLGEISMVIISVYITMSVWNMHTSVVVRGKQLRYALSW